MPTTTPTGPRPSATRSTPAGHAPGVVLAAALDAACVLGFAAAGRSSHAETGGLVGVLGTAWPFLVAAALGWAAVRGWRRPTRLWPTGVAVWAATWAGGLVLRGLAGEGLAPPFVAVSGVVLGVALLGWRGAATAVTAVRRRRATVPGRRR